MADQAPSFPLEAVPLDEARRMGRGPRMEPMLYDTLRQKIQALSSEVVRIHLGPEIRPERMKNYILQTRSRKTAYAKDRTQTSHATNPNEAVSPEDDRLFEIASNA
jgi:hypothetical protein